MTGKGYWSEGTALERSGSKTREDLHKRMLAIARLDGKHGRVSAMEASVLKARCASLYAKLRRETDSDLRGAGVLLAALMDVHPVTLSKWRNGTRAIGKRVWSTLKMAEIAAEHDPQAVVDWCRARMEAKKRTTYNLRE